MIFFQVEIAVAICLIIVMVILRPKVSDVTYLGFMIVIHFFFAVAFYYASRDGVTDSHNYFLWSAEGRGDSLFGTGFVVFLVGVIRSVTGDDYFSALLAFSGISAFGASCVYVGLSRLCSEWRSGSGTLWILRLGMLMPGLHLWTAPIGKDSLMLLSYGLLTLAVMRRHGVRWTLLVSVIAVSFLVRPHVGGCAFLVLLIYLNRHIVKSTSGVIKWIYVCLAALLFIAVAVGGYVFFMNFIQKYSAVGFDSLADFLSERSDVYSETGSGFDASSYPYLVRYFLFLLGGIPWAIAGVFQLLAMVEGLFIVTLLAALIRVVWRVRKMFAKRMPDWFSVLGGRGEYLFYYAVCLVAILSFGAGNFGLIARQRVMVYVPMLVAFVVFRVLYFRIRSEKSKNEECLS